MKLELKLQSPLKSADCHITSLNAMRRLFDSFYLLVFFFFMTYRSAEDVAIHYARIRDC